MAESNVRGLFPIPFMEIRDALPGELVETLAERARRSADVGNSRSDKLSHTTVCTPDANQEFETVNQLVQPRLGEFGELLFGERLTWHIKEMWLNLLATGGGQGVHSHANSFISCVIYLTESHPSTRTVFYRSMGGRDFAFSNEHRDARVGEYNAPKWAVPEMHPGDLVLFPSYLLHEVPNNQGDERVTLALNAVPDRLKSWDYELRFR